MVLRLPTYFLALSAQLTVLTTRLLPPLCIYSILHTIHIDDSPQYRTYVDKTLYHNECVLQLTSWWWTFMGRNT